MELKKCKCGGMLAFIGSPGLVRAQCRDCRTITGICNDENEASLRWNWLQSYTPKVTAQCVTEIAAAVPDGEVAKSIEPFRADVDSNATFRGVWVHWQPMPLKPLTGQAWAEVQEPGTVFEFAGTQWLVSNWRDGVRLCPVKEFLFNRCTWCASLDRWTSWNSSCDNLSDETVTIIYKPETSND